MFMGIILIISGLLIALYPPLLSMIVAALLVGAGGMTLLVWYRLREKTRKFDDPFIGFFMGP
ncbi:MAG TPA: hypothetical protein PKZ41_04225 [Candidatus Omnitrophota bacterium]|nr:hypothetical protein [Candidatus Omnitrophota bacterium]